MRFILLVFLLFVIAKIATISIFPKILLLFLIKIVGCRLKISVRYLKISGLKIAVHSLKIAGLKIIARVCVYACMRALPILSRLAKWHRMHPEPERPPRAGAQKHKHQSDHHRNTSDHHKSSMAGAQPQERERDQSERTSGHAHPIRKRK